ncbi:hypothetical protein DB32_002194 [Sandaracinus amylolyticus]|uniref:Uncharacterized protein n=1 Tax=Sandaracinus amylolyticus TaxID=927083 RepID=A0A0F6YHF0_9BACT|nr:hypothetical protein DB32_002194 [Sandaracinus amylolyticus]
MRARREAASTPRSSAGRTRRSRVDEPRVGTADHILVSRRPTRRRRGPRLVVSAIHPSDLTTASSRLEEAPVSSDGRIFEIPRSTRQS